MHEHTRTEYTLLNTVVGLGGYALNMVIGFICRVMFVRCLSADYLGMNGLFTNVLSVLSLAELGVSNAIVFALYKPLAENDEEKIASLVKFFEKAYRIIGLVVAVAGLALLPVLPLIINEQPDIQENIYVLYLINLFNTASTYFFSYRSSLLIAAQQNYLVIGLTYVSTITQSILQIVVLQIVHSYLPYLLIQTACIFINNVVISRIAVKQFPFIAKKGITPLGETDKKGIFANVRDLMIYKLSGVLVDSTDNILITFFEGLSSTGITSNYTILTTMLNSLLNQTFSGLNASIGNHNVTESEEKRHKMFQFIDLIGFWLYGWASLGIYFCSTDLVHLCFGIEYVMTDEIPFIMALNFYVAGITVVISIYKQTMGIFHRGRFMQLVTAILNIVFSVLLGEQLGVFGILAATAVSRIATSVWYTPYVVYKYGFHMSVWKYVKRHGVYWILVLLTAFLCNLLFQAFSAYSIANTFIKIVLCSLVVNLVFGIAFCRTEEFLMLIQYCKKIIEKLRSWRGKA